MQHIRFNLFLPLKLKWPFQNINETLLLWAKIETKPNRKNHFGDSQLLLKAKRQSPEMVCKALPRPGPWLPFLSLYPPPIFLSTSNRVSSQFWVTPHLATLGPLYTLPLSLRILCCLPITSSWTPYISLTKPTPSHHLFSQACIF